MEFFYTTGGKAFGVTLLAALAIILNSIVVHLMPLIDLDLLIALLLVIYPLIALLIGAASGFAGLKVWIAGAISLTLFTGTVLMIFNSTALAYVPIYLLVTLAGFGGAAALRRFYTRDGRKG